jgi:hypothetical protein
MDPLLQDLKMNGHFLKDFDPGFNHEVINGLGVLIARPHDPLVL